MANVITLSSDDDDYGEIQIIGERQRAVHPVKEETVLAECSELIGTKIDNIAPSLNRSSVTISKVKPTSRTVCSSSPPTNGDAHHGKASDDSDDDIICLENESVIKNAQPNGKRCVTNRVPVIESTTQNHVPDEEAVVIPSDEDDDDNDVETKPDENGNLNKHGSDSPKSDIILIDSEDGSDEEKSSEGVRKDEDDDMSDDDVRLLENDESNACSVEDGTNNSQDGEGKSKPEESENKPNEKLDRPSTSRESAVAQPSTSSANDEEDELCPSGPGNLTEKLLKQLNVKISRVGFSEENQAIVTKKIMKYYSSASEEFTQSQKFIDQVKGLITEMSRLMALPNSKDIAVIKQITDKIKEFLGEFQRGSTQLTPKLNKLHKMLSKLNQRIAKLEEQEVDSDSEYENPYIMLDRYRKRAVQVYNKIRQLEGKSSHADRLYLQEFIYSGVGPIPIQRALEKYYNKTKVFPDFSEVYKLVKKVNSEKSLGLTPSQVHLTAQDVFTDFGKKLKRRREYDDFLIARSYLPECHEADPADNDPVLREQLELNKTKRRKEEDIIHEFAMKEAAGEGAANDKEEKDSGSTKSDSEHSESEKEGYESDKPKKMFMDSDEEMEYFENVERRRRPGSEEESSAKRQKLEDEKDKASGHTSLKDQSMETIVEEPETVLKPTKDKFLSECGLQPS